MNTMKKSLTILTAALSLTIANAKEGYWGYRFSGGMDPGIVYTSDVKTDGVEKLLFVFEYGSEYFQVYFDASFDALVGSGYSRFTKSITLGPMKH